MSHVARQVRRRETPWPDGRYTEGAELEPATELVDPALSPEAAALASERSESLFRAVRALPLAQRQTLSLVLEGFNHREVGETLGMTENHVAVTVHRAKKALREALAERCSESRGGR